MRRLHITLVILLLVSFCGCGVGKLQTRQAQLFVESALEGRLWAVEIMLASGMDPNTNATLEGFFCGYWEFSALHAAVWRSHADVVQLLLRSGARVDQMVSGYAAAGIEERFRTGSRPDRGYPFGYCCGCESEPWAGADKDKLGVTALMIASSQGDLEIVKLLMAHKSSIDSKTASGATALMLAAMGGHTDVLRILLANGADGNRRKDGCCSAFVGTWCRRRC